MGMLFGRKLFLAGGCLAAMAFALPASAAPAARPDIALSSGVADMVVQVKQVRKKRQVRHHNARRHYGWHRGRIAPRYHGGSPDTVGSVGYDGYGYGYNRFSGQRYQSCVTDEGYGRTRPCDAGGGGGGGMN
jgi:hypothetical protein